MAKKTTKRSTATDLSDYLQENRPPESAPAAWPLAGWFLINKCDLEMKSHRQRFCPPNQEFSLEDGRKWVDSLILYFRSTQQERPSLPEEYVDGGVRNAFLLVEDVRRRSDKPLPMVRRSICEADTPVIKSGVDDLEEILHWFDRVRLRELKPPAPPVVLDPYARLSADPNTRQIGLDGKGVEADVTHVVIVHLLIRQKGVPISRAQMRREDSRLKDEDRIDRIVRKIWGPISTLIKSDNRGYYILREDLDNVK